jgi:hypothetical protein
MSDYTISKWLGLNTVIKDINKVPSGASPDSLNWITGKFNDNIQLRRGTARLGLTEITGTGKVTGLGIGLRYDGVEIPFFSYGRKVKYYNVTTDDVVEVGTDLLPAAASGEDVWIRKYANLAGSFVFIGSSNSGIYKIPVANPGSAVDQSVNNYRFGVFHIGQSRSFAGQRNGTAAGNQDKTGLYLSYIDKALLSSYTQVTGEAYGTGDAATVTFAHSLTAITAPKTAMYISVTDTVETFIDDRNGNMIGSLGGTGTVNYATGAVSVTFNTAPAGAQAITCSYYHETSTSAGILDYSGSGNGQGKSFRQDDGGNIMAIFNLNTIEYCFHLLKTWQLQTTLDDTNTTNLPYRFVGIPYHRSACQAPEGILFADMSRPNEPKLRRLEVLQGTNNNTIEPISISDILDLSPYAFDYCVAFRWGDYDIFCVQEKLNGVANTYNSVMFIRNTVSGAWDKLDYYASCLTDYSGTLVAGDSISNNLFTLFSGFDELGDVIENHWISGNIDILESPRKGITPAKVARKTVRRMCISGLIQSDQSVRVSLSFDNVSFTQVFVIDGRGAYVESGVNTSIGSQTIGSKVVGGGGESTAHPFEVDFSVASGIFEFVQIKFEALGIGFVEIDEVVFRDIRNKGYKKNPNRTV